MNRQFYCSEDESTVTITYQYVYCKPSTVGSSFTTTLEVDVGGSSDTYEWYDETDGYVPSDASTYADGYSFAVESTFACVDANGDDFNVNGFDVSYTFPDDVDSADSILIHIYNYVDDHRYWFMIGNVQVRCLGRFLLSLTRFFSRMSAHDVVVFVLGPTSQPTKDPTLSPSFSPSAAPTLPTRSPTNAPTNSPSRPPSVSPSLSPSVTPTSHPTAAPSSSPSNSPSIPPTLTPTAIPSISPSRAPTDSSSSPTNAPSNVPSSAPIQSIMLCDSHHSFETLSVYS